MAASAPPEPAAELPLAIEPVYKALSRTSSVRIGGMSVGVSYQAAVLLLFVVFVPFLMLRSLTWLTVGVGLYVGVWLVERTDRHIWRLAALWLRLSLPSLLAWRYWRARVRGPFQPRRY